MPAKGVSQTMWIIIAIIVILVTALVVLTVFGGGVENFLNIFNPWVNATAGVSACKSACASLCAASPGGGEPAEWIEISQRMGCTEYPSVSSCACSDVGFGFGSTGSGAVPPPGTTQNTCLANGGQCRTAVECSEQAGMPLGYAGCIAGQQICCSK